MVPTLQLKLFQSGSSGWAIETLVFKGKEISVVRPVELFDFNRKKPRGQDSLFSFASHLRVRTVEQKFGPEIVFS